MTQQAYESNKTINKNKSMIYSLSVSFSTHQTSLFRNNKTIECVARWIKPGYQTICISSHATVHLNDMHNIRSNERKEEYN